MKRILSGVVVLVVAAGFAAAEEAKKPITVPFELFDTKHMAINIKVNGKGPYRMVFDTGAPMNLINNKLAKEADLIDKKNQPPFALFGAGGVAKIKTLEFGDTKLDDVQAQIMDHPYIDAMSKAFGPVYGIIGYPVFARYKMTIDYQAKTLTLVPNDFKPTDTQEAMMSAVMGAMGGKDQGPKVVSPAGQWGFSVEKAADKDAGVVVKAVLADGPAAAGGLKPGDRLLTLDDRWTDTVIDAYMAASLVKPGTEVVLKVKRDGKEVEVKVKPTSGL